MFIFVAFPRKGCGSGSRQESGRKLLDGLTAAQKLQMLPLVMPLFGERADGFQVLSLAGLQRSADPALRCFGRALQCMHRMCRGRSKQVTG